ncbi:c-type cytochrome [Nibricoccus sp. IMCC34717]|uniref:c-type cytochrome n=1 Tax=Nibricoccus sp. IMCC34717 TaxID=3034021 RepID=UPI003850564D
MRLLSRLSPALALVLACLSACAGEELPPAWAYVLPTPGPWPVKFEDDGQPRHVPGSDVALTRAQFAARKAPIPDWHPEEHPQMPDIVRVGREPKVWACGYCHLPNGAGRPENSSLAGLSVHYIKQQVLAFRDGQRTSAVPARGPQQNMVNVSKAVTDDELEAAAVYFSTLKPEMHLRVIESEEAPRTFVAGGLLAKHPAGGTEPLAGRVVEVPDSLEQFEDRDSRTSYTVYVPLGSIERGRVLCETGGEGRTLMCSNCHGMNLEGAGDVPRLAGRSPSYLMRQLVDMQTGGRTNNAEPMKPVLAGLNRDDLTAIVAYLAHCQSL